MELEENTSRGSFEKKTFNFTFDELLHLIVHFLIHELSLHVVLFVQSI